MSTNTKIKILIVEDHSRIAEAWSNILTQEGHDVIGISSGEKEGLDVAEELNPDIVLMDINLKEGNGISCTQNLMSSLPNCKVITLSMYNDKKHFEDMFNAGAVGYVTKNSSIKEILNAIEVVLEGGIYICDEMKDI